MSAEGAVVMPFSYIRVGATGRRPAEVSAVRPRLR